MRCGSFCVYVFAVAGLLGACASEDERGAVGAPLTPAAYCIKLGYASGVGACTFPDGTSCEEWAFFRGECGQAHSYCNQHGGVISTKRGTSGTATVTYAVCDRNGTQCTEESFLLTGECK